MKKTLWLALILLLVCTFALSACDNVNQPQTPNDTSSDTTDNTTESETDAHVHSFGKWTTVKDATCIVKGEQERSCSCGEKETKSIDATDHTEVVDAAVAATCTTYGKSEGKHCSVCDFVIVEQTMLPLVNHTYDNDKDEKCNICDFARDLSCKHTTTEKLQAVEPTCESSGLTVGTKCSDCGEIIVLQTVVPAKGHTPETINGYTATCIQTGMSDGKRCSACGVELEKAIVIPIKPHEYTDKYDESCNKCGFVRDAECAHREAIVIRGKDATCTEAGLTDGCKCTKCGEILVVQTAIDALGHVEVIDSAVAATCATEGKTEGKHCSRCKTTLVAQATVSKLGHVEVIDSAVAATCTTDGKTEGKHCSRCNITLVAQTTVGALGHVEVIDSAAAATCTTDGKTEGKHCSRCSKVLVAQTTVKAKGHTNSNSICSICGDNTLEYASGIGTKDFPYLIATVEHMRNVGKYENAHYKMISDIDFSGETYTNSGSFTGVFDGNNHKILNLNISVFSLSFGGVFGVNHGTIKNVYVVDSSITCIGTQVAYCGAIAGANYGKIFNCHNVNTEILAETNHDTWSKHSYAGGIAGENLDGGTISKCSNTGRIKAVAYGTYTNRAFWSMAGGIVGMNRKSSISDCYNAGYISASSYTTQNCSTVSLNMFDGGIAGAHVELSSIISKSYSDGISTYGIACNDKDTGYYYGGKIEKCYHTEVYGGSGATGVSSIDLEKQETFVGFDFDNIWMMGVVDGDIRPIFKADCEEHTAVKIKAIEADCTSSGRLEGSYCSTCFVVIEPFFSIPSLGHSYDSEFICTRCQVKDPISGVVYQLNDDKTEYYVVKIGNKSVSSIEIPDFINNCPVTTINAGVFSWCENLETIILPNCLTSIGDRAFEHCVKLKNVIIPNSVISIGSEAFYWCENLETIILSNCLTSIGKRAFIRCSNLTSITIPNSVTTIGNNAFDECSSLTSVTISNSVTSIASGTFVRCPSLTSITIPNSVTTIGNHAFENCSSLTSITISNSVTSIGASAFSGCSSLTDVYYKGTEEEWKKTEIGSVNGYLKIATIHFE